MTFQETMKIFEDKKCDFYKREIEDKMNEVKDELVQYFIVNSELTMSAGKIAAQVAHVATIISHKICKKINSFPRDKETINFEEWFYHQQPKIILRGKQKEMEKLIEQGWYYIRDNGRTEIAADSLTVIGYVPEYKSIMRPIVKRFQLL